MSESIETIAEAPKPGGLERTHLRFGTKDHQVIPFEWAEELICWVFENKQDAFADGMLYVMGSHCRTSNARKNARKNTNGQLS